MDTATQSGVLENTVRALEGLNLGFDYEPASILTTEFSRNNVGFL